MSQKEMLYEYLLTHKSITPRQAAKPPISSVRLADLVYKLRKDGKVIETCMVTKKRGDRVFSYAEYRLCGEPNQKS